MTDIRHPAPAHGGRTPRSPRTLPLPPGVQPLTRQEAIVVTAVANGGATEEISRALAVTPECIRLRLHRAAMKISRTPARAPGRGHLVHQALTFGQIPPPDLRPHHRPHLSADQWTVLHSITTGIDSRRQIARETGWPPRTAAVVTDDLLHALGSRTVPHAVYRAWEAGLLGPTPQTPLRPRTPRPPTESNQPCPTSPPAAAAPDRHRP